MSDNLPPQERNSSPDLDPAAHDGTSARSKLHQVLVPILAVSLALNLVAVMLALKLYHWDQHIANLYEAREKGIDLQWETSNGSRLDGMPSLFDLARGARPTHVYISKTSDQELDVMKKTAEALREFGTLQEVSLPTGSEIAVDTFLGTLGPQPHLTDLYCFGAQFSDRATLHLANFPKLKNLAIVGTRITGELFPVLPALENCDFSHTELTPAGLRRILACPALIELHVTEPEDGSVPLRDAFFSAQKTHPSLRLWGIE